MSRIGKKVIDIPSGVEFNYDQSTRTVKAKGPLGTSSLVVLPFVKISQEGSQVFLEVVDSSDKFQKSMWGTTRSLIANLLQGVSKGFTRELELNGVGFKMELGKDLTLYVGFSHPVVVTIPEGINLKLEKNKLTGTSSDKQLLGNFFGKVFAIKPCDVYHHKGFKVPGKYYPKKEGKKAK